MAADTDSVAYYRKGGSLILLDLPSWLQRTAAPPGIRFGSKSGKGSTDEVKTFPEEPAEFS